MKHLIACLVCLLSLIPAQAQNLSLEVLKTKMKHYKKTRKILKLKLLGMEDAVRESFISNDENGTSRAYYDYSNELADDIEVLANQAILELHEIIELAYKSNDKKIINKTNRFLDKVIKKAKKLAEIRYGIDHLHNIIKKRLRIKDSKLALHERPLNYGWPL